jgi:hypothetical protein
MERHRRLRERGRLPCQPTATAPSAARHAPLRFEILEDRNLLAAVVGRDIFYNQSVFDGNNAAIGPADDGAIAPDKFPYLGENGITIRRLTDNDTFDSAPQVLGGQIIWQGRGGTDDGNDDEIFLFDGTTILQLTTNDAPDRFPKISNLGLMWERGSGTGQEVIFHSGASETPLTANSVFDGNATLSDNRVAWEQGSGEGIEIISWDGSTTTNLSQNSVVDRFPNAHGNRVAWRSGSTPNAEILLFDGTSVLPPLASSQFSLEDPSVGSQWVAWEGFAGAAPTSDDEEIYYYDGSTTTRVTTNTFPDFDPQVSGQKIVWWGGVFSDFQVYLFDGSSVTPLSSGTRNRFPRIDGDMVVWQGFDGNDDEIYLWNGTEVIPITDNDYNDTNPQISGNHIVWQGEFGTDGTTFEIFDAIFGDPVAVYSNITNYSRGINGIMVDLAGDGDHGSINANDFVFKVGNNNSPSTWAAAPAPDAISVRGGAGVIGSDRVEITWAAGTIKNTWLEVQVLATANTGLTAPDVFFWGNRVGDTTDPPTGGTFFTSVASDGATILAASPAVGVGIESPYDINRTNTVNVAGDRAEVIGNSPGALLRIRFGTGGPFAPEAGGDHSATVAAAQPAAGLLRGDSGIASALARSARDTGGASPVLLPPSIAQRLDWGRSSRAAAAIYYQHLAAAAGPTTDDPARVNSEPDDESLDWLATGLATGVREPARDRRR